MIAAGSGLVAGKRADEAALLASRAAMQASGVTRADLAFVFATADAYPHAGAVLTAARRTTGAETVIGCSGAGVLTEAGEVEGQPAVAVLVVRTGGAPLLTPFLVSGREILDAEAGAEMAERAGVPEGGCVIILPDAVNLSPDSLLAGFADRLEPAPVVGGVAAGTPLFEMYGTGVEHGALTGCAVSETPLIGVGQGCEPIGEPLIVTAAVGSTVHSIAGRPPLEVLRTAIEAIPDGAQRVARSGLFAGLAIDLGKSPLERGDFLIRSLSGADHETGWISLAGVVHVGQTIQFQIRDARSARDDLEAMLARLRSALGSRRPGFGIYFNCAGRGCGLYEVPNHDVRLIRERLGEWPLIGFFGNGEFAPVGRENFFHTYTGVLTLFPA